MTRFFSIIFLILILSSCQAQMPPISSSSPTTEPFPTQIPTATATVHPTSTVTPTLTIVPTATTSPKTLEESAGTLCEKAFSAPVVSKEFEMPYLEMRKTERDATPAWKLGNSIPHLFALSSETVHSIICSLETRKQAGIYTDGSAAFRLTLKTRILSWPDGTVVFSKTVESGPPPKTKVGFGGGYGSYPEGSSIKDWILDQFEHPDFLYFPKEVLYASVMSPNGDLTALGMSSNSPQSNNTQSSKIVLLDIQNLRTVSEWNVHAVTLYDLAYSPDGNVIASAGSDSTIYFWDAQTGEMTGMVSLPSNPQLIKYSPDSNLIGVMTISDLYLIDAKSLQVSTSYPSIGTTFSFSSDGKTIYTNFGGYDTATGTTVFQYFDPTDIVPTIAPDGTVSFDTPDSMDEFTLSPDGTHAASYSSAPFEDTSITEHVYYLSSWDMKTQERVSRTKFVSSFAFDILGFSPNGKQLAVNINVGEIWLLNTDTWQVERILAGHTNPILELVFSPDGRKMITISTDRTVRVWSLEN